MAIEQYKRYKSVFESPFKRKLQEAIATLVMKYENGGHPFAYFFSATKEHLFIEGEGTAATDGLKFFWYESLLKESSVYQLATVLIHECLHIACMHCLPGRFVGENHDIVNIALDFTVNAMIDRKWEKPFDKCITFDMIEKKTVKDGDTGIFNDPKALKMSPEKVLEWLKLHLPPPPPGCSSSEDGQGLPGSVDEHMQSSANKQQQITEEIVKAYENSKSLNKSCGNKSATAIDDLILEIMKPKLSLKEFLRRDFIVKRGSGHNDWKRFKKRDEPIYNQNMERIGRIYRPEKKEYQPRCLVCLDTSGSMGPKDWNPLLTEVLYLGAIGEVVCNDTLPFWDKMIDIRDFKTQGKPVGIVGRGGTDFKKVCEEWKKKTNYKTMIILTDGEFDHNIEGANSDVIWVSTGSTKLPFKHSFNV